MIRLNSISKVALLLMLFSPFCMLAQFNCSGTCSSNGAVGPNILANQSFEDGPTGFIGFGFAIPGWETYGNVFRLLSPDGYCVPQNVQTAPGAGGPGMVKMFGSFSGDGVMIGAIHPATAGETYYATIDMYSPDASSCAGAPFPDHLGPGNQNFGIVQIQFLNAAGDVVCFSESNRFDHFDATHSWRTMSTIGVAPAGATGARLLVLYIQPGFDGGAIYYDNATLGHKSTLYGVDSPQIVCNDHVNVTANSDCTVDITVDALIEGGLDSDLYTLEVTGANGLPIDLSDVSGIIGTHESTLRYTVRELCGNKSCWGYITIEDKEDPVLMCADCVDPLTFSDDCLLNCAELPLFTELNRETGQIGYDENLLDDLIPSDPADFVRNYVTDNCGGPVTAYYTDSYNNDGNCETGTVLTRTWVVNFTRLDGSVGTLSCNKYYMFQPLGVYDYGADTPIITETDADYIFFGTFPLVIPATVQEDTIVMPKSVIEIPTCNVGTSPAELMAFFDDPTTIDRDTDDDNIDPDEFDVDCVIESNEGVYFAYPYYYLSGISPRGPHPQPVNKEICNVIVDWWDTPIETCAPGCYGNSKTLRTWTIFDWCQGDYFEYDQVIKVVDDIGPSYDLSDVRVSVDPWNCTADVSLPAPFHYSDNCDPNLSYHIGLVEGALQVTGNQADGYVVHGVPMGTTTVQYVVEDCCGNQTKRTMRITVVDETLPVPVTVQNIVVELTAGGPSDNQGDDKGTAKLYAVDVDNGSYDSCTDVEISIRRSGLCNPSDTIWGEFVTFCCADLGGSTSATVDVQFRVLDWNGNENIIWSTILLEDKNGGALVCPPDMVLRCDQDIWNFDITGGIPRVFTSCAEVPVEVDTLEVYEDTEPRNKPANQGLVPGYIGVAVPAYDPSCGFGAWRREFENCTQWFVVEPIGEVFDPHSIVWPADIEVDCDGYDAGEPTWLEATCQLVGSSVETEEFTFEVDACIKVINTWTVINWCEYSPNDPDKNNEVDANDADGDGIINRIDNDDDGNGFIDGIPYDSDGDGIVDTVDPDLFDPSVEDSGEVEGRYEHVQVIKVIDTVKPTVESEDNLCFGVNGDCVSEGVVLSAVGTDEGDCSSAWISWEIMVDFYNDWTVDCVYSSYIHPTEDKYVAKTASGEAVSIALGDGIAPSNAVHRVEWRVSDGCGNQNLTTTYFTIEDKKPPTPYCLNLSTAVMSNGEVELWAIDFNQGSWDNCTSSDDVYFTFTDVAPPPRCDAEYDSNADLLWYNGTFWFYNSEETDDDPDNDCGYVGYGEYEDIDAYGGEIHRWEPGLRSSGKIFTTSDVDQSGFIQIPVYVWDASSNIDYCVVSVRIIDNGGGSKVSGVVKTESEQTVEDVMTQLMSADANYPKYDMTEDDGLYAFENNVLNQDYEVSGSREDDYRNGVSTADLVMIQRHVIGTGLLDSPYKMIAADINGDNRINGQDLVELRKLILGIYTELPQNSSWKIIDAQQELSTDNPWIYRESRVIADMSSDMEEEDFIGVKIGDVDGNVIANSRQELEEVGRTIRLSYDDGMVSSGEEMTVSLSTEEGVYGYQFTMAMDKVELISVEGQNITDSNVGVHEKSLTLSVHDTEEMTGEVLNLTFRAKESGQVHELLSMSSEITKAEAYVGEGLEQVGLSLHTAQEVFSLGQNEPNPFREMTNISYTLPESGAVKMTLYDVTGKVLRVIREQGQAGMNVISVSKEGLTAGVIYYQLESGSHTATKHMIVIE